MGKVDKKRLKLQERIDFLEIELRTSLTKKTSDVKEINVASHQRQISELRQQLQKL